MLMNLLVGLPVMLLCLILQVAVVGLALRFYAHRTSRLGKPQTMNGGLLTLLLVMMMLIVGNFLQIVIWGWLFMQLGEFTVWYDAVYHSGVNFTSLGYGDVVMSKDWKLLGPLEAGNGILMFGMTAAVLMAILQELLKGGVKK
ncbi:potassium channel family protein [Deefgea rivuli]|uniref:potassium channel family protein n=1 Tax=Deefgea rivuli TaxID=400948 RepID=UPI000484FDE1|nr:potassium channel family protein [Deefgea rivuli]